MGRMLTQLNIRRVGAPVSMVATRFIAHTHDMLVLVNANACHGLIFQNRPLWGLVLASLMLCAFQNGKIRRKWSCLLFWHNVLKEPKMRHECHISSSVQWLSIIFPRWTTIILYSWACPLIEMGSRADLTEYTASWRTCLCGGNTLHCACTRYARASKYKRVSRPQVSKSPSVRAGITIPNVLRFPEW